MAAKLWSNVAIAVQSALGSALTITAITKASPGVATSASHGLSNGAYVVLTITGMSQLDGRIARVANVTTNTFELESIDTTSFDTFSSGSCQAITFGTTLSVISDVNVSGGDFDMIDITTIHDNVKKLTPGAASPVQFSMTANWDPSDAGLTALKSASDARAVRAVRVTFSDATKWLCTGYIGCTLTPTGQAQGKVSTPIVITAYGRPTTYTT